MSTSSIEFSHLIIESYICYNTFGMSELAILLNYDMTVYCHVARQEKDKINVSYLGVFC